MSFPSSPTDGQLYSQALGTEYRYDSTRAAWLINSQEITGATGVQGIQGATGTDGVQGDTGADGIQGATGVQGVQGATGIAGVNGETGVQGNTGAGIQGATGVAGADGSQGETGIQGDTGAGIQGETGLSGTSGGTGIQGETGAGIQGATGVAGVQGATGAGGGTGGITYWTDVPTDATRISNTAFSVQGNYIDVLSRGTIIKWDDTTTADRMAMDASSNYTGTDTTVNLIGDVLTAQADMATMQYGLNKASMLSYAIPGKLAAAQDIGGRVHAPYKMHVHGADVFVTTAGTTNNTSFDCTAASTSLFTVKPFIVSGATTGYSMTADTSAVVGDGSAIKVSVYSVSTTAPTDGWVQIYFTPENYKVL
jgi:hypothetical protein